MNGRALARAEVATVRSSITSFIFSGCDAGGRTSYAGLRRTSSRWPKNMTPEFTERTCALTAPAGRALKAALHEKR